MNTRLDSAKEFATEKHGSQLYGNKPYIYHLAHVESVATRFGYDDQETVRICCILHDVVEDTDATLDDVNFIFGTDVMKIVDAVTDREGETKEDVFRKRTKHCHLAIIVKMCDRIANIEACLAEHKTHLLAKYVSERELFTAKHILNSYGEDHAMAMYLEELCSLAQLRVDEAEEEKE